MKEYPIEDETNNKLDEAVRDRRMDTSPQVTPTLEDPPATGSDVAGEGTQMRRRRRETRLPKRYDDMVMAITSSTIAMIHEKRT
jgi:hypothetical protein